MKTNKIINLETEIPGIWRRYRNKGAAQIQSNDQNYERTSFFTFSINFPGIEEAEKSWYSEGKG